MAYLPVLSPEGRLAGIKSLTCLGPAPVFVPLALAGQSKEVCTVIWLAALSQCCSAAAQVWDSEKIILIPDHYIFTEDERANRNVDIIRWLHTGSRTNRMPLSSEPIYLMSRAAASPVT